METASLVDQVHSSPELWELFKWVTGILLAGYGLLWVIVARSFSKRQDGQDSKMKGLSERMARFEREMAALELETKTNYVSYTVFNALMKEFKDEIHTSMREVRDELKEITVFLRDSKNK